MYILVKIVISKDKQCGTGFAVGSSTCKYIYGWVLKILTCPDLNYDATYIRIIDYYSRGDSHTCMNTQKRPSMKMWTEIILKFCRMALKTTNLKENLRRHYILSMEDPLWTIKNNQCH